MASQSAVTRTDNSISQDGLAGADDTSRVVKYQGVVTQVGGLTADFRLQGLVIFFGEDAPEELHEFAVLHRASVTEGGLGVGDDIILAGHRLPILAVGSVANENLVNLGHLDLKANGETVPPLPGDVCVPVGDLPALVAGDTWSIEGGSIEGGPIEGGTHPEENSHASPIQADEGDRRTR